MAPGTTARARLVEFQGKVDRFFDRVLARHRGAMMCGAGCADCCQAGLSITAVEAAAVVEALAALPVAPREDLRERARRGAEGCAALDDGGRCAVYAARPIVCRSHGVPIRIARPGALPLVGACDKNFGAGLESVAPDDVLDQATLSTVLAALDAAYADEIGGRRGERAAIRDLVLALSDGRPAP